MEHRKPINTYISSLLSPIGWRTWLPSRGNVVTLMIVLAMFWAQSAHALPGINQPAAAASTGIWPYQGQLANSAGAPITAAVPMIFRLYNAATGGTPLWEEQWIGSNSVQVTGGLFNVMLGSLTAIPQSVVSSNTSLWLGIAAGTDAEMTPRIQLGSVPFAAQALTIPDGSITMAKIADANITTTKIANGAVTVAKLGADVSFVPPDGSVTTVKIADGAVTQPKAPSLIASANTLNVQMYFGSDLASATGTQTVLLKTIMISPACSHTLSTIIITPRFSDYADIIATSGIPVTSNSFDVVLVRPNSGTWSNGQIERFDWLAIC